MTPPPESSVVPAPLQPGATIGLVAPSTAPDPQRLKQGVEVLREQGFRIRQADNLQSEDCGFAGDVELRCRETMRMFDDPDVDAVICVRGGKGAIHILDRFLDGVSPSHPKPFVGYSDATILQLGLYATRRWITFSGPMVATEFGKDNLNQRARNQFWNILSSSSDRWSLDVPSDRLQVWREGTATGPLLGGCLSLVQTLLGTPYLPSMRGAVLMLEDVDEAPYRIDRMLHHLRISGVMERIGGLILGSFPGSSLSPDTGRSLREIVQHVLPPGSDIPILAGFPCGHRSPDFRTVPLGAPAELRTNPPEITLKEPY